MTVQQMLKRFDSFPCDLEVVHDGIGREEYPCAVRVDTDQVVIDTVSPAVASLDQAGLIPYKLYQLRSHLASLNLPFHEVVLSDYEGYVGRTHAVRMNNNRVYLD